MGQNKDKESDFPAKLAKPARRALVEAGYFQLEQLADISEVELLQLHGMGPKALEQLRIALSAKDLKFANHTDKNGSL